MTRSFVRVIAWSGLCALAGFLVAGCRTVDNPAFCCMTPESCAAKGAAFPNGCPDNEVCDDANYTCVPKTTCTGPEQCTSALTPYCVNGTCQPCQGTGADTMGCTPALPACDSTNRCAACTGEPDCAPYSGAMHCATTGTFGGQCVGCRDSGDCGATSTTPICDPSTAACRGCTSDAECTTSGFCDEDTGKCVDELDVIYLNPSGQGGPCSHSQPCRTINQGLALVGGTRTFMLMEPGTYLDPQSPIVITESLTIHGFGADVKPHMSGEPVVEITDAATVVIEGVRVHGGGDTSGMGVYIHNNNSLRPKVSLRRMKIDTNAGGGVSIQAAEFELVNDFIVDNGLGSPFGGVLIEQISAPGLHTLAFDTISGNTAPSGTDAGVECALVSTPLRFASDIVYDNNASGGAKQVGGANCGFDYSDFNDVVAGTMNVTVDPLFKDVGNADFHLMPTSPMKDAADPAATVKVDYDGDVRPQGPHSDIGADELAP